MVFVLHAFSETIKIISTLLFKLLLDGFVIN